MGMPHDGFTERRSLSQGMTTMAMIAKACEAPGAPSARGFAEGVVEGLARPSAAGLAGALAVVVAVILSAVLLLTEERLASLPDRALMMRPSDEEARISQIALRGAAALGTRPVVWILGASDTREMLGTEAELNGWWVGPRGVRVASVCADGLLFEERAALVEKLRPGPEGAIVLGISLRQFCRRPSVLLDRVERYRLGFRSPAFDEEVVLAGGTMPPVTGQHFLDNRKFLLRRSASLVRRGDAPAYQEHRYRAQARSSGEWLREWERVRFSRVDFEHNAGVISRLVARNRRAGGPPVILLEIPSLESVDPVLGGRGAAADMKSYRAAVRGLAEREGLVLLDPGASVRLGRGDFADMAHVGDDGARKRFSEEFLRQLTSHVVVGAP